MNFYLGSKGDFPLFTVIATGTYSWLGTPWGLAEGPMLILWLQLCCSVDQSCLALCDPVDCSTPSSPVLHHLPEFAETQVPWVHDAIQPFGPLSSPSPPAFNPSQDQGFSQWLGSSHQVAKVLELQPPHQSLQWTDCSNACSMWDMPLQLFFSNRSSWTIYRCWTIYTVLPQTP